MNDIILTAAASTAGTMICIAWHAVVSFILKKKEAQLEPIKMAENTKNALVKKSHVGLFLTVVTFIGIASSATGLWSVMRETGPVTRVQTLTIAFNVASILVFIAYYLLGSAIIILTRMSNRHLGLILDVVNLIEKPPSPPSA